MKSRLPTNLARFPTLSLDSARQMTGLDLVSAREVLAGDGTSYHEMEARSESQSHDIVRGEGIGLFVSLGYKIFPEGVGIRGTYTMADFLAVRDGRTVFVEVLSDTNIKPETLERKAQLQKHAELCFLLFSGTKRSDDALLVSAKRAVEGWADVLYCRLHGYNGNYIQHEGLTTVEYDTTYARGIRVSLAFERSGKKLAVVVRFLTHLYSHPMSTPVMYPMLPTSYRYEEIFLRVFRQLETLANWRTKTGSRGEKAIIRATRRKAGLKLRWLNDIVAASFRTEYRGDAMKDDELTTFIPSSRDLPPEHMYGVYTLERSGPEGLRNLVVALTNCRLTPVYEDQELRAALLFLEGQTVPRLLNNVADMRA